MDGTGSDGDTLASQFQGAPAAKRAKKAKAPKPPRPKKKPRKKK